MSALLSIALGGCAGALARHGLGAVAQRGFPASFPGGTLVVNLLGCLAIGAVMALFERREGISESVRLLVLTGFLGSFTTFSTFGWGTMALIREGQIGLALMNIASHVVLGLLAVAAGYAVLR